MNEDKRYINVISHNEMLIKINQIAARDMKFWKDIFRWYVLIIFTLRYIIHLICMQIYHKNTRITRLPISRAL